MKDRDFRKDRPSHSFIPAVGIIAVPSLKQIKQTGVGFGLDFPYFLHSLSPMRCRDEESAFYVSSAAKPSSRIEAEEQPCAVWIVCVDRGKRLLGIRKPVKQYARKFFDLWPLDDD
jgi:hypothetical protein